MAASDQRWLRAPAPRPGRTDGCASSWSSSRARSTRWRCASSCHSPTRPHARRRSSESRSGSTRPCPAPVPRPTPGWPPARTSNSTPSSSIGRCAARCWTCGCWPPSSTATATTQPGCRGTRPCSGATASSPRSRRSRSIERWPRRPCDCSRDGWARGSMTSTTRSPARCYMSCASASWQTGS